MKKSFKVLALALVAMSLTVACNNKTPEQVEDTIDTVVIDTTPVEDTTPVVEEVVETPAPKAPAKKNNTPKAEPKQETGVQVNVGNNDKSSIASGKSGLTVKTSKQEVTLSKDAIKVEGQTKKGTTFSVSKN